MVTGTCKKVRLVFDASVLRKIILNQHRNLTLANVVLTRFRTEPQYSDSILSRAMDQVESYLNLFEVRLKHSIEHRQFQIQLLGFVKNGSKILRQTRTTESKSRFK